MSRSTRQLAFGASPRVITRADIAELARAGGLTRLAEHIDGKSAHRTHPRAWSDRPAPPHSIPVGQPWWAA